MVTGIDSILEDYLRKIIEDGQYKDADIEQLFELVREIYCLDEVFFFGKINEGNIFQYNYLCSERNELKESSVIETEEQNEIVSAFGDDNLCDKNWDWLKKTGSCLQYGLIFQETFYGCICFYKKESHKWTEEEKAALSRLSRVSLFHIGRRRKEREKEARREMEYMADDALYQVKRSDRCGCRIQGNHISNKFEKIASAIGKEYFEIFLIDKKKEQIQNISFQENSHNEEKLHFGTWVNDFVLHHVAKKDQEKMLAFFDLNQCTATKSQLYKEIKDNHGFFEAKLIPFQEDEDNENYIFTRKNVNAIVIEERKQQAQLKEALRNVKKTEQLLHKVTTDKLTGLYDKEYFFHKMRETFEKNPDKNFLMIYGDVEKFKLVNDSYGTYAGDTLLKYIAEQIKKMVSEGVCARIVGDEFAVMIPDDKRKYNVRKLIELQKRMDEYIPNIKISLRFGIYRIEDNKIEAELICDRAKIACNSIKGKYETIYAIYDEKMRSHLLEEQFIVSHMKKALDREEFEVYYQPIYSAKEEKIVCREALVRWKHPEKGMISPYQFISVFENNGFITKLDLYVLEHICRNIVFCRRKHYKKVPVSLNLSRKDFYSEDLFENIMEILDKYQITNEDVHFEITESACDGDTEVLQRIITQFKEKNFEVWMDDFGSGYSSLNTLKDFDFDVLKIDMKFFENFGKSEKAGKIVSAIMKMAKSLDLNIVAEGIETEEGISFLKKNDCDMVQGYYYARPMPFKEFEMKYLKSNQ